ncbi:MAG: glycosyltransferase [Flavobacteriales bacterium]|nr:glycosyltransferase [Flavobacteriales bacterium]
MLKESIKNKNIAVLIPHYNNPEGLIISLKSIEESHPVDVVIVDDGSVKKPDIPETFSNKSIRNLKIIPLEKNSGICKALNAGLEYIMSENYKYIARLDCDDLCLPNRFGIQSKYLDENKNIVLLGANSEFVDENYNHLYFGKPKVKVSRSYLFAFNPFMHDSVMFTRDAVRSAGYYPTKYPYNEDHAYWLELSKYGEMEILPEILVKTQLSTGSQSPKNYRKQRLGCLRVMVDYFKIQYLHHFIIGLIKVGAGILLGHKIMRRILKIVKI